MRALQVLDRVAGVVDDVPLVRAGHRQQVVVERKTRRPSPAAENLLLDPAVAAAPDVPVVEVGLARVDRDTVRPSRRRTELRSPKRSSKWT